jgi:4-hydroxythreonine-4-phosphate dehydrogenase
MGGKVTARSKQNHDLPLLALTTGDPAGIGPEITVRLFTDVDPRGSAAIVIGAVGVLEPWLSKASLKRGRGYEIARDPGEAVAQAQRGGSRFVLFDTGVDVDVPYGRDSEGGGLHAGTAIKYACELVKNWSVQAIVTAPISKKSLNLANFQFSGHTEMLARYLNAPQRQMMMVWGNFRVVPLTRHFPVIEVSENVTEASIETCVRVVADALVRDFGIESPRIAVASLNPHSGEGGVLGSEEELVIEPALNRLRAEGFDLEGPIAADALFPQAYRDYANQPGRRGRYDTYISMYHDQGLTPFKMLAQRRGVNVTAGLPCVRTSVDHGVAYDIAGRGKAETESLNEAYKLAEKLSLTRMRAKSAGG